MSLDIRLSAVFLFLLLPILSSEAPAHAHPGGVPATTHQHFGATVINWFRCENISSSVHPTYADAQQACDVDGGQNCSNCSGGGQCAPYLYKCPTALYPHNDYRHFFWSDANHDVDFDPTVAIERLTIFPISYHNPDPIDPNVHQGPDCSIGNPISIKAGNKYEHVVDYQGSGVKGLVLERHYNSLDKVWRFSYSRRIETVSSGQTVRVREDNGRGRLFSFNGTMWVPSGSANSHALFEHPSGWTLTKPNGDQEDYNTSGQLVSVSTPIGQVITVAYDPSNRLSSVTHFSGRSLSYQYDPSGKIATVTTPAGRTYDFAYGANNRIATVTYPDSTTFTYHYEDLNDNQLLTGKTDESGTRIATYAYDANGIAVSTAGANGVETFTRTEVSLGKIEVVNPLGKKATYSLGRYKDQWTIDSVVGEATALCDESTVAQDYLEESYGANGDNLGYTGFVDKKTDKNGHVTDYDYDPATGLLLRMIEAVGTPEARTTTYVWDTTFRKPLVIERPGQKETFVYDGSGRVLSRTLEDTQTQSSPYMTTGNTRTWTYTYNMLGLVETVDGPRTSVMDVTSFTYDMSGDLASISEPGTGAIPLTTQIVSWDPDGRPLTILDPNGVQTDYTYDYRGRVISSTVDYMATTTFEYDLRGLLVRIIDPIGVQTNFEYDDAHRLIAIDDYAGNRVDYTLDSTGNRISETTSGSPSLQVTRTFDELSRLVNVYGANGQADTFSYDTNDNPVARQDALWRNETSAYDALDRLIETINPDLSPSAISYDARDNIASVSDFNGNTTTYVYDGLDNLIQLTSPDSGTTTFYYDSAGNLIQSVEARGVVTDFTYDEMNRVTAETFPASPSEDIQYTYDSGTGTNVSGRLASISDESGITTLSYDARGNVIARERTNGGQTFLTSFDYDLAERLVAITYPSGRHVSYVRDPATGRVSDVDAVLIPQPLSFIANNFTYASRGPVTSWTSGSGDFHNRTLDQDYRITGIGVGFGVYDVGYNYDVVNNVLDWNDYLDYTKTQNFTYDNLDRLDFVFGPTSTYGSYGYHSYQYDQNGNRIDDSKSSVYRQHAIDLSSNRMTSIGTDPIGYDAVGNKVSDHAGTRVFTYNHRNRLSTVVDNGVNVGSYVYNALGQRSQKTTPTSSIDFVYDLEGKLIGEYDNGVIVREYIYAHGMPIAQADATDVLFLHPDHLGTPRVATDNLGTVVWRWDSTAFGEGAPDEDPDGDSILVTINLRFPGQYFDAETGENYNYFRSYDPSIGRYTQSDPIGLEGGLNTYGYGLQNPNRYTDPRGLAVNPYTVARGSYSVATVLGAGTLGRYLGRRAALWVLGGSGVLSTPSDSSNVIPFPDVESCPVEDSDDFCERWRARIESKIEELDDKARFIAGLLSASATPIWVSQRIRDFLLEVEELNIDISFFNEMCSPPIAPYAVPRF